VNIEALYHSSRTSHHTLPTDMLTYCHVLTQNDSLEYTRRNSDLPHDDARTHKSLEKKSAPRHLRLPAAPSRSTAAAHALAPPLRIRTAVASASRASSASSSSSSAVSTWASVNEKATCATSAAPAGSAGLWDVGRRSPCSRTRRARNFFKLTCAVDDARRESTRAMSYRRVH
jgi:hypothetical protein